MNVYIIYIYYNSQLDRWPKVKYLQYDLFNPFVMNKINGVCMLKT